MSNSCVACISVFTVAMFRELQSIASVDTNFVLCRKFTDSVYVQPRPWYPHHLQVPGPYPSPPSLVADPDAASVESTAEQVCEWIRSFKDHHDRFHSLLRLWGDQTKTSLRKQETHATAV